MNEQWKELKETIIELRDNNGAGTQQEVCRFLANLMDVLEKQMQEPKTGYISIDNVMSVFDDFMCGDMDEDGTDTFLEMLKDKAESEDKE